MPRHLLFESLQARIVLCSHTIIEPTFGISGNGEEVIYGDGSSILLKPDGNLRIRGSVEAATLEVVVGNESLAINLNEREHQFALDEVSFLTYSGGANDNVRIVSSSMDDYLRIGHEGVRLSNDAISIHIYGEPTVRVYGEGGNDTAEFYDTQCNDVAYMHPHFSAFAVDDVQTIKAVGFERTEAYSSRGGTDRVRFYDSVSNDRFAGKNSFSYLEGDGFSNFASGFDRVDAYSFRGGTDEARLHGSSGDDQMTATPQSVSLVTPDTFLTSHDFARTRAYALEGDDKATIYGLKDASNHFEWNPASSFMHTTNVGPTGSPTTPATVTNFAIGFGQVVAHGEGGQAEIIGSQQSDEYVALPRFARMETPHATVEARDFVLARGFSGGGEDVANLWDSSGDDRYVSTDEFAYMYGSFQQDGAERDYINQVNGFSIEAFANRGGHDRAWFYDLEQTTTWLQAENRDTADPMQAEELADLVLGPDYFTNHMPHDVTRAIVGDDRQERVFGFHVDDLLDEVVNELVSVLAVVDCLADGCHQITTNFLRNKLGDASAWTSDLEDWRRQPWNSFHALVDDRFLSTQGSIVFPTILNRQYVAPDFAAAKAAWDQYNPHQYSMQYEVVCRECDVSAASVFIEGGKVISASNRGEAVHSEVTVDWLFEQIQNGISRDPQLLRAEFDAMTGRPTVFMFFDDFESLDDSLQILVKGFHAVPNS